MTPEQVKEQVAAIEAAKGDPEDAHGMEDDLHQAVLKAIATGTCQNPQGCAAEALKTLEINFNRWYA